MILWEKGVRSGKFDATQFVAVTSTNAAKIFNLYPRKGKIAVGSDADIVVWGKNPKVIKAETHHSAVDFNIFEGMTVQFSPIAVISNGKVVLDENGSRVSQGTGRFVPTPAFSPYVYNSIKEREKIGAISIPRDGDPLKLIVETPVANNNVPPQQAANNNSVNNNTAVVNEPVIQAAEGDTESITSKGSGQDFFKAHTRRYALT